MSETRRRGGPVERERLTACVRSIDAARTRLREARSAGVTGFVERPLRADLLAALERYEATITQLGAPVPRRLQAEIELYRGLDAGG